MATQHTEKTILENFLLPPAPLHALLSLKSFSALFPSSQRSSPEIRALYRNLQVQRARTVDKISQNIAEETKRGLQQRRAVVRAREAEEEDDYNDDEEIYLEESALGPSCNHSIPKSRTLKSILPELDLAVEDLTDENRILDEEEKLLLDELRNLTGVLGDLRYGKLENAHLRDQVLEVCTRLDEACDGK